MFLPSDFYILKEKNLIFFSSISPGEGFFAPPIEKNQVMSQQQLTESQLPITHEVLIERNGDKIQKCANSKQIDDRNKTNPNNQNHLPILGRN